MPVDLKAIRAKLQELQGTRRSSNIQFWKVGPGVYNIRVVPWPAEMLKDGQPFVERHFYYIGENRGVLAPEQFGKEDPIAALRIKLYQSGDPGDREVAGKLRSKMRCYLPIVERGKEDEGIKIWSFGKLVYQRLLNFFLDEQVDDWTDPETGRDLKVTITQQEGKRYRDTTVDLSFSSGPLLKDADKVKELCENVPNMDDVYKQKSTEEIEKILNDWLSGGEESDGSSRNSGGPSALDELVNDVKGNKKSKSDDEAEPAKEAKKSSPKKTRKSKAKSKKDDDLDSLDDGEKAASTDLDSAFEELMDD